MHIGKVRITGVDHGSQWIIMQCCTICQISENLGDLNQLERQTRDQKVEGLKKSTYINNV